MHWSILAPYFSDTWSSEWLDAYVPGGTHTFKHILRPVHVKSWHQRKSRQTDASGWMEYLHYSRLAWRSSQGGFITVFPQLAMTTGLQQRLFNSRRPIVAYNFNMGHLYGGAKQKAARAAMKGVDRFIVHARREQESYAEWLALPRERFTFLALPRFYTERLESEDDQHPFLLAMGSANRDYRTLFEAVRRLNLPTVVVAASHALEGLTVPDCVEVKQGLSFEECRSLAQRARVNLIPLAENDTAAGQITVVEAMHLACTVVATDVIGTEDYIESGRTGILVPPSSSDSWVEAIRRLWEDQNARRQLGQSALSHAREHLSLEAAGRTLGAILDEVELERRAGLSKAARS